MIVQMSCFFLPAENEYATYDTFMLFVLLLSSPLPVVIPFWCFSFTCHFSFPLSFSSIFLSSADAFCVLFALSLKGGEGEGISLSFIISLKVSIIFSLFRRKLLISETHIVVNLKITSMLNLLYGEFESSLIYFLDSLMTSVS